MNLWTGLAAALALTIAATGHDTPAWADPISLQLEEKIPLGNVEGRIDHLGVDLKRQRLFVAELGNNSVGVIDLATHRLDRRIGGLDEPQGVAYDVTGDTLYVSNGGDGSVGLFQGAALSPASAIQLGKDADNIRIDAKASRIYVGYGSGGIAVIDPAKRTKLADIRIKGHPESFALDAAHSRIFANVPDSQDVAVIDAASGTQVASWPIHLALGNFPMAYDTAARELIVGVRWPARLWIFRAETGEVLSKLKTCGDADDIFVDEKRHRLYVSCGEGLIDVFERRRDGYTRLEQIPTRSGARTCLYVPELDRLFVAVRAGSAEPAAVWVYRPTP